MQGKRKQKAGRVVSDKMDKTIVVSVERLTRHPLYKRVVRMTTKFSVHDELNQAKVGDTVLIEESRPLSRTKRWRLVEVTSRAGEDRPSEIVAEESATTEVIHAIDGSPRRAWMNAWKVSSRYELDSTTSCTPWPARWSST